MPPYGDLTPIYVIKNLVVKPVSYPVINNNLLFQAFHFADRGSSKEMERIITIVNSIVIHIYNIYIRYGTVQKVLGKDPLKNNTMNSFY